MTKSTEPATTASELIDTVCNERDFCKVFPNCKKEDFCLKVQGKEEYLLQDVPLYRFKVSYIGSIDLIHVHRPFT